MKERQVILWRRPSIEGTRIAQTLPILVQLEDIKKGDVFQLVPIDDADAKTPGTFDRSVALDDATHNKDGVCFVTVEKPEPAPPIGPSIIDRDEGGLDP